MLRNLTVYKASAGSGKTFRLAYEFIRHQLGYRDDSTGRYRLAPASAHGGNRHRAILAITFTNKATEEMKRRIVRELAVLAGAPLVSHRRSDYAAMLTAEFGCTGRERSRPPARRSPICSTTSTSSMCRRSTRSSRMCCVCLPAKPS